MPGESLNVHTYVTVDTDPTLSVHTDDHTDSQRGHTTHPRKETRNPVSFFVDFKDKIFMKDKHGYSKTTCAQIVPSVVSQGQRGVSSHSVEKLSNKKGISLQIIMQIQIHVNELQK
jgi:hypothetical protein